MKVQCINVSNNVRVRTAQEKVAEVADESVGSFENYYNDNGLESEARALTRQAVIDYAMADVMTECPREVRFMGKDRITEIVEEAADRFEYRGW